MKRLVAVAVVLIIVFGMACKQQIANGGTASSAQASTKKTLNLILAGPYVLVQVKNGMDIWVPCVREHGKPFAYWVPEESKKNGAPVAAASAYSKEFERGEVSFTSGISGSSQTQIVNPVANSDLFAITDGVFSSPKAQPYLVLHVPTPREIVPWNADPMRISVNAITTSVPLMRHATLVLLRFDVDNSSPLEMKTSTDSWRPAMPRDQAESFLFFRVNAPSVPENASDEHAHARDAFNEEMNLLGIKRNVEFQNAGADRNKPLDESKLTKEVIDTLQNEDRFMLFGHMGDCHAALVSVKGGQ